MADCVLDSCCLINLCAAADLRRWLPLLGFSWHLPSAVARETLYLRSADAEGNPSRQAIDLQPCIDAGILAECDVESAQESELYVQLAADLDDGEAMAMAIAKARGWLLATDNRKPRRRAAEMGVSVITTPELMKRWVDLNDVAEGELRAALGRIRDRARFVPGSDFPLHPWWLNHLVEGGEA